MERRQLLQGVALATLGLLIPGNAEAISLSEIGDLSKTIGAAVDAVVKLGDAVVRWIQVGARGWDVISARQTRAALKGIAVKASQVAVANGPAIDVLSEYSAKWSGRGSVQSPQRATDWNAALDRLSDVLVPLLSALEALNRDRSDLVLQPAYLALQEALEGRRTLISRLRVAEPPRTSADFAALRGAIGNYRLLHSKLLTVIRTVDDYIARLPR